ncbi:hypothetical protein ABT336_26495 [Micromonospora sp. NPDC000207]|uniref:hypothetical protein n=1 Tax=Micromonospora sp. NPDC000207 TaxID=3154246 RepID=UPI00331E9309
MRRLKAKGRLRRLFVAPFAATVLIATIFSVPAHAVTDSSLEAGADFSIEKAEVSVRPPVGEKSKEPAAQRQSRKNRWADEIPTRPKASATKSVNEYWALQMNLCSSGIAGCWNGVNAVIEAGDLIYYLGPDLVTLNEVCYSDVDGWLWDSFMYAWAGDMTYMSFSPAWNAEQQSNYQCLEGRGSYGNAVIGRFPPGEDQGFVAYTGRYTVQDASNEKRSFGCVYAVDLHLACVTHLSALSKTIAMTQCNSLMTSVVPQILSLENFSGRTIVNGDLNLKYNTSDPQNVQNCVPSGYSRKGDGDVQHTIYSNDYGFLNTESFGIPSDKLAWLVRLDAP